MSLRTDRTPASIDVPMHVPARARALLSSLALLLGGCGGGGSDDPPNCDTAAMCPVTTSASTPADPATGDLPTTGGADTGGVPTCKACAEDQVCIAGQCTEVPAQCPCPVETYCDLSTSMCVIGCTNDDECDAGRICDPVKRECFVGCREDAACGAGEICEGLACGAGCREDSDCGPMQICDGVTCRQGCTIDGDCPQGQVCDDTVCRQGCTEDSDCPLAGDICDTGLKVCRAGCHANGDCPLEKVCEPQSLECVAGCDGPEKCGPGKICKADQCVAGCDGDADCGVGQICEVDKCVAGCHSQDACPIGQYCFEDQCIPGCGPPNGAGSEAVGERCPLGQACVPTGCDGFKTVCESFVCQDKCFGGKCSSTADQTYDCIGVQPIYKECMLQCDVDADCPQGQVCALQAVPPQDPFHSNIGYCRNKCFGNSECQDIWYEMSTLDCECQLAGPLAGSCAYNDGGSYYECSHLETDL